MTNDEIRELIQLVVESGVAELEVQRGEDRVRIRRTIEKQEFVTPGTTQPITAAQATIVETGQTSPLAPNANEHLVKSPIVGTYYDAPKPGDPAFVKVGDTIEPGQVLCIIESMKLMNEIESEVAGTVVAKLMENGRPVEYGAPLFTIRPH